MSIKRNPTFFVLFSNCFQTSKLNRNSSGLGSPFLQIKKKILSTVTMHSFRNNYFKQNIYIYLKKAIPSD